LLDFEHRRGLHDFLDPRRIVHTRKLHKNLVLAEPVLLDHRLAHAELVNAVADGLDGLGDRAVLQVGEVLRLHRNRPGIFRARAGVVIRQPVGDNVLEIAGLIRRNALDHDHFGMVHRIGLGDVGVIDLVRPHVFFEARNRVVGIDVDRVVHLHLQDQVRPAAQIEAQMNAVGDRCQQPLARPILRNAEDAEQEKIRMPENDYQLPAEVLIHENQSIVVSRCSKPESLRERPTTNDYFPSSAVVTDTTDARLISSFRLSGGTRKTSASSLRLMIVPRNPPLVTISVPVFQLAQHSLPLFLLPLLRQNQQEVKNGKDEQQRRQSEQTRAPG
jgi:hypothetical protein